MIDLLSFAVGALAMAGAVATSFIVAATQKELRRTKTILREHERRRATYNGERRRDGLKGLRVFDGGKP